ncbi:MAG: L-threonylcarbamoyladenylate synthase [Pseudoruegeria sp.]
MHVTTKHLLSDSNGLSEAAQLLRAGGLVAFPTETVYGLGADATNGTAVARIFEAKQRPQFNPLIIHLPTQIAAQRYADFSSEALSLAQAFWPGPLTLVLPLKQGHGLSPLVTSGLSTVGIRIPDAPLAHDLLTRCDRPIAAPSANPSGQISPTRATHVLAGLSGRIDGVVDGGACGVGVESTIIGFDGGPTLLRPGGLALEQIEHHLGYALRRHSETDLNAPTSPGQLLSHYAPGAAVRLNAIQKNPGEALLGFGPVKGADLSLSPTGDLIEAAANLFEALHALDKYDTETIAVSPIPNIGLGRAINDRLRRAAAPRV